VHIAGIAQNLIMEIIVPMVSEHAPGKEREGEYNGNVQALLAEYL
jgi:hypothetical protein